MSRRLFQTDHSLLRSVVGRMSRVNTAPGPRSLLSAVAHTGPCVWPKPWFTWPMCVWPKLWFTWPMCVAQTVVHMAYVCDLYTGPCVAHTGPCVWPEQWDALWHNVSQSLGHNAWTSGPLFGHTALWPMQCGQTVAHALWPKHWLTL